jgi:hypothetical protein
MNAVDETGWIGKEAAENFVKFFTIGTEGV